MKRAIEAGKIPGPKLDITGPYLEGQNTFTIQMHQLSDPDDAARLVDYWAAEGVTSFKAYNYLTADELKAAIDHAHAHGFKITGHLCSIGFKQAAALASTTWNMASWWTPNSSRQKAKPCPSQRETMNYLAKNIDVEGAPVREMIADLVAHHVAITSTLAIFETMAGNRPPMERESAALKTLNVEAAKEYLTVRAGRAEQQLGQTLLLKEMQFEHEFVAAGGLLMAGCDTTGYGGVVPASVTSAILVVGRGGIRSGRGDPHCFAERREIMGKDAEIGSIAPGKAADIVVFAGNPADKIENVEKVEMVFKDGVG